MKNKSIIEILYFLFILLSLPSNLLFPQKSELIIKKEKLQNEIKKTQDLINRTLDNKQNVEKKVLLLDKKIKLQKELLDNLTYELNSIDSKIQLLNKNINENTNKIENLKNEYAKVIYHTYFIEKKKNILMFLFAAENFNIAYRRLIYVKQYIKYRKSLYNKINRDINNLIIKNKELVDIKLEKEKLKLNYEKEKEFLENDLENKKILINKLATDEKALRKNLNDLKENARKLEDAIKEEIRRENERRKIKNKNFNENVELNSKFELNMGKLPWPVKNGIVISSFGEHNHAILKGIKVNNNGIDISTECKSDVNVVFDGVVSKIFSIKGTNFTIIVRHGDFYTVYQNIIDLNVKVNENVKTSQKLGTIGCNENSGVATLHFEIWKEFEKLNPEKWLKN